MKRRFAREWLLGSALLAGALSAPGCGSSAHKKAVTEEAGEAGVSATAGASDEVAGTGGDAGSPANAGTGGAVEAGAGGAPADLGGSGGAPDETVVLPECEGELTFDDSNFEASVRAAVDIPEGPVTGADVATIKVFTLLYQDGVTDITGIECLSAIETLSFGVNGGGAKPLAALAALRKLRTLDLHDDYLDTDAIEGLAEVTQLTSLDLSGNFITSYAALGSLVSLKTLKLDGNDNNSFIPIDATPLGELTQLQTLTLDGALIADIAPLSALKKLESLSLAGVKLTSLSALSKLTQLTSLDLSSTTITSVTELGALPAIQSLWISNNPIASLAPLVDSTFVAGGDEIYAEGLDCATFATAFTALTTKGVTLHTDCTP